MKKRTIFNVLMFLLILVLGYILYKQIQEPIAFQQTKTVREKAVIDRLVKIRKAQEAYRGVTGKFAPSFEALTETLKNGRFMRVQVYGDVDDVNQKDVRYDTTYMPAIDSIRSMGIELDELAIVPYGDGAKFDIEADTVTYQSALVDVVQVGTTYEKFMGDFKDARFKKYDEKYDPKKKIKFGDLGRPLLTGSWE
jgi:type I restriction-modification system DNA methylase subunit